MEEQRADTDVPEDRFEMKCGVMLAVFASILAIMELGGSYSDYGMNYAQAEKVNAYAWYNSKSIKQNLAEGQRDTLKSLMSAGVIGADHFAATGAYIETLDEKIAVYEREKHEILIGSASVGQANWAQELDGELGRIVGAKVWEQESDAYGEVTEIFDLANLFLQICLVVGAISLVVQTPGARKAFYRGAIGLGLVGTTIGINGFLQYLRV